MNKLLCCITMILVSCTLMINTIATPAELTTQLHAHLAAYHVENFETAFEQLKLVATADEFENAVVQLHEAVMKLIAAKQALMCDKRSHHALRGLHVCCGIGLGAFAAKALQRLTRFELWKNLSCIYNPPNKNPIQLSSAGVTEITFDWQGKRTESLIVELPELPKNELRLTAIEELLTAALTSAIIVALFFKAALDIQTGLTANTTIDCQELKKLATIATILESHLPTDSERNPNEPYSY